ncbi:DUF488 family protein [Halosimplex pelagicum]|uniref:DUF488 family protein n=1 Tax=Halosimplex pelagicum TaxID=869886 RepID=A0A7D5PDL5_9EURY|nr:DUF488 family protein [Halosimplex pelagicum]QLH83698.1 DUF488 family protein [Halosimplex pelagicum]
MSGTVTETYAAALQHDIADLPGEATRVGVVRRPTGWFAALVDENRPELGPPESLLSETKDRQEDLRRQGLCDEGAHNAAWEEVNFATRYREHLASEAAAEAIADLAERVAAGETVALVCFEGDSKRCHRRILDDAVRERAASLAE